MIAELFVFVLVYVYGSTCMGVGVFGWLGGRLVGNEVVTKVQLIINKFLVLS